MTSKEAMQELWKLRNCSFKVYQKHKDWQKEIEKYDKIGEVLDVIQKDLDRLETLELNLDSEKYHLFNENQSLKNRVEDLEICFKVRVKENEKLEKAIGILKNKLSIYLEDDKIRTIPPIGVSDRNKLSQDEKELLEEVLYGR